MTDVFNLSKKNKKNLLPNFCGLEWDDLKYLVIHLEWELFFFR